MVQQEDLSSLSSSLNYLPEHSWADSMRHWKNFSQSSAISNDLAWTEERFQPPKSHQIVDGIHYQIKSSLFFSLFRTGQSLNLEREKARNKIHDSRNRKARADPREYARPSYTQLKLTSRPLYICMLSRKESVDTQSQRAALALISAFRAML